MGEKGRINSGAILEGVKKKEMVMHNISESLLFNKKPQLAKTIECLMVAIDHRLESQDLIWTTYQYASVLDAPWMAVHIDCGYFLNESEKKQLKQNLALARKLNIEVIVEKSSDVAESIGKIAKQKNVTQIVMGRPKKTFFKSLFNSKDLISRIIQKKLTNFDIHVIHGKSAQKENKFLNIRYIDKFKDYFFMFFSVIIVTFLTELTSRYFTYHLQPLVFFTAIVGTSFVFSKGAVLLSTVLYLLIWSFFFISPVGLPFQELDFAVYFGYVVMAFILTVFSDHVRERSSLMRTRKERTQLLYDIINDIATSSFSQNLFKRICRRLDKFLKGNSEVFIRDLSGNLFFETKNGIFDNKKEKSVANWVLKNEKMAGWSTDTFSNAENFYIPLKGYKEAVGVLGFHSSSGGLLKPEEIDLLITICQQLANYIERKITKEEEKKHSYLRRVDEIQHSIHKMIAHKLQHQLYTIQNSIKKLNNSESSKKILQKEQMWNRIDDSVSRLSHMAQNIRVISNLSTGKIKIHKTLCDFRELIHSCLSILDKYLIDRSVQVRMDDQVPKVYFDFNLMHQLLCNLIINAVDNTPKEEIIHISLRVKEHVIRLSVAQGCSNISPDSIQLFQALYRSPLIELSGLGVDLAHVKAIVDMHNAKIEVLNPQKGVLEFAIFLPLNF